MRVSKDLRDVARELAAGIIDFGSFVARTRLHWKRFATALFRRWTLPPAVTTEDVEQEMLLAAYRLWPRFKPELAEPAAYLVFHAHAKALKWMHKQRGAGLHGCPERRSSICPTPASWLDRDDRAFLDRLVSPFAATDSRAIAEQTARLFADAVADENETIVLKALGSCDGDVELAAGALYSCAGTRAALWLTSEAKARRATKKHLASVRSKAMALAC